MSTLCEETSQVQDVPDLIPARMLNEFSYCPRLAYLEWVQGEFADSLDTLEGRFGHRRVDQPNRQDVPEPSREQGAASMEPGLAAAPALSSELPAPCSSIHTRSLMLSAPAE